MTAPGPRNDSKRSGNGGVVAMPHLDWLRSFEAAARLSNFTAAAAELGLTQAAISQHIRALEGKVGRKLFNRLARGVELTPDGAAYLPHIQSAFATIANSTHELFEPAATHSVPLRSPVSFATLMIAPLLPRLSRDLPLIELGIETIHRPGDYGEESEMLDIRFGHGDFAGRRADRLTDETLVPMGAASLAGVPDWHRLPRLSVVGGRGMWREWFSAAGIAQPPSPAHKFDTFVTAMQAAREGAGVLLGSRPLADAALREGSLVMLSDFQLGSGAGHFLTAPSGRRLEKPEADLRAWLVAAFAEASGIA
ncbi:LysR family transcriptional regulator [Mesorhizobium sp. LHD-90]|uniref:LysR family transcriptional regulator n=1 Tax=Mesorhizobium sp. LHD-90 TaxID=3071414 RepID=UPI0027E061BA|nr:LysR family transcriptional regulator [Mesorhizobium sp. LHD-90]MDQ6433536.1 LysR family transcriptional regulator [Mesorhizobium sp. LHD-90]